MFLKESVVKLSKSWVAAATLVALTGAAQAALVSRPGGMVYDTTLNITWLADWNYARTSGFDADGAMAWTTANDWANNLVYGGYSDWRLPTSLNADGTGPCQFFNCAGSEMGHMFYNNWGARADNDFSTGTNAANLALFSNVQSYCYWSGTEYARTPGYAWGFGTFDGYQTFDCKYSALYAVAVRPGDVAASAPEPATFGLVGVAMLGIAATRRRKPPAVPKL